MTPTRLAYYACPGIDMPEDEYVACYRAGHVCPPKVAHVEDYDYGRITTWRCPCCGDFGGSMCLPWEMLPPVPRPAGDTPLTPPAEATT